VSAGVYQTASLLLAGAAAVGMAALWVVAKRIHNHGIMDVGWTYLVGSLAVIHAVAVPGAPFRRAVVATPFAIWAARLGTTTCALVPWFPRAEVAPR